MYFGKAGARIVYPTNGRHPCTTYTTVPYIQPGKSEWKQAAALVGINLSSKYPEPLRCDAECCAPVLTYYAKNASLRQGLK